MTEPPARPIRVMRIMGRANVGGPALQAVVLQRELVAPYFDTLLVVGRMGPGEEDYLRLRAPDVQSVMLGWGGRLPALSDAYAFLRLLRLAWRFKPDIVHTHTAKAGVLGRFVAILCRTPVRVHTFHGHLLHGYFGPRLTKAVVTLERLLARRTTCLVAVGEQVRDELLEAGIGTREQFRVVAPGVPLAGLLTVRPHETAVREELGITPSAPVVGYVGRLVPIKRIDRLAELLQAVGAAERDAEFVIVGDGPERAQLERLRPQLGNRLHLLGWRSDIAAVLGAMDVVVNVSENEGMPVALIEAGAAAKPVVATAVGSTREVVVDEVTGYVLPYDHATFLDRTLRLIDDKELRADLGAEARDRVVAKFSDQRLAQDMADIYKALCPVSSPVETTTGSPLASIPPEDCVADGVGQAVARWVPRAPLRRRNAGT